MEGPGDRNDAGTEGSKDSHGCWYGRAHAVALATRDVDRERAGVAEERFGDG